MQIDTEVYDPGILRMLNFQRLKPIIINFEHGLQQGIMCEQQLEACFRQPRSAGYYLLMEKSVAVARLIHGLCIGGLSQKLEICSLAVIVLKHIFQLITRPF